MNIRHFSSVNLSIADNDEVISIEFDLSDIYLNYQGRRLMIADHELFDLLKDFMDKH